jgi:hypothetical protein
MPGFAKTALIDMEDARSGGFGGPVVKLGTINGDNAVMIGGEGGGTFTSGPHSLIIGGAGYGLVNELEWDASGRKLEMGYAGLLMGYTHKPDALVHWESKVLLGAGNVSVVDAGGSNDEDANFLVSEFSLSGEVNVTDFLEIGIGGAYRLTSEPLINDLDAGDISGPSVFISFQFGQI